MTKNISTIAIVVGMLVIVVFATNIKVDVPTKNVEKDKKLFPGILGDMVLIYNETGLSALKNITIYDDFRGDPIQGYIAKYKGNNGTMSIIVAQMSDNKTSIDSAKDMVIRLGYNESSIEDDNSSVIRLPYVLNPEIYVIQKKYSIQHYVFAKEDEIYWIAFSKPDSKYIFKMLKEIYVNIGDKPEGLKSEYYVK